MSATVWPPISHEQLMKEEEKSLACELEWLLNLLQESLASLKSGLQECVALLAPKEPGSTLALSSLRSESVKGFVTRIGTRIIKGDINLRLTTLPPPRSLSSYPVHLQYPVPLPQLTALLTLLNQALDIIDISRWTGDPHNGAFISGQLRLLADTIGEAQQTLKGGEDVVGGKWWEDAMTEDTSSPSVPPSLSLHLSIADAALLLHVRTLAPPSAPESSLTGLSLRTRLGLGPRPPVHDELGQVFHYRGEEVTVKEKVRVESQDPSLMAVLAKLSALGHAVGGWRLKVGVVMGEDLEGDA
ncbi:hypothetical protein HO173_008186 [Letharia columbiana]|uniref:RAVE subunit 2/Rogdi n=1 Tax=Letharia columbiana TaxID=112416 RepID=A0A8H6FS02_9LECA|nr:uncharacterized protein HO173_008186 [Letharia columbiana]KAF6233629.1 hypothetical protein HO173_008186 [Letharia columbiana]